MISNDALHAPVKIWTAACYIGDTAVDLVDAIPRRSHGFNQPRGVCSLQTLSFAAVPADTTVDVYIILNDTHMTRFFTGRVGARPIADLPLKFEVGLVDGLADLEVELTDDVVFANVSFTSALRQLLAKGGITDAKIATIHDPGTTFAIGPVDKVTFTKGSTIRSAINTILTFGGCGLFVLPDGRIDVRDAPGWPGDTSADTPVYAYGATGDEFGFFSSSRAIVGTESVVKKYTAKGNRLSTRRIADATFTLSGVTGTTVTETFSLLQTDACARAIAEREIVRRNRSNTEVDVSCPLNPNLWPGDTVLFRHPDLGFPTNTPAIIVGINTNGDEMSMTLSVGARPGSGEITIIPPPSPSFTMRFEVQPVKLAGMLDVYTLVECTDTSTDPSEFSITGRAWEAKCAGNTKPEPETVQWSYDEKKSAEENPIPNPVFIFPTLEGATVTLVVESTSGEGNELTKAVVLPPAEVFTRTICVAAGTMGWRILAGSQGWRSYIGAEACTAVPTINDQGPLIAGFGDGTIYQSQDYLATPPTLLATLPEAIQCLWVNEGNPLIILAGAGTGLYRSDSGGTSWAQIGTFGAVVSHCENSPTSPCEIRVCAGNALYLAMDGTTFTPLLTGPDGSLCRKVGSAPWGHLAVFSGVPTLADAIMFEEGLSVDWSQVSAEHLPTDLATVTPLQYETGYLVADSGASDMIRDGLFSQLGYLANQGLTNIYKLLPGGSGGFVAQYCATTDEGGPHKVLMAGGRAFPIDISDALRIGYGQATDPARPPKLVVLPYEMTGASDALWIYEPDLGAWSAGGLPLGNAAWVGLDICPGNANELLIWTAGRIFWSGDGGQHWVEIFTPPSDNFSMRYHSISSAGFVGRGSTWHYALISTDGFNNHGASIVVGSQQVISNRYVAGTIDWPYWERTTADIEQRVASLVRGYDGELWGKAAARISNPRNAPLDRIVWVDPDALSITEVGQSAFAPACVRDPSAGRAGLAVWNTNIGKTDDYRSGIPADVMAVGASVVSCQAGIFVGGRENGIAQIAMIDTAPVISVVAAVGVAMGPVVAGSRRYGAGAVSANVIPNTQQRLIYAFNGTQWAAVMTPEGVNNVCPVIGVIEP